jgi:hypothetical protein
VVKSLPDWDNSHGTGENVKEGGCTRERNFTTNTHFDAHKDGLLEKGRRLILEGKLRGGEKREDQAGRMGCY